MAYHTYRRDPLLDGHVADSLRRRFQELFGILLILTGLAAVMILWTYSPEDAHWLKTSDQPVSNMFGRFGSTIAAWLYITVGWAAWGFALILFVWGWRFLSHNGTERLFSRVVYAPIAIMFGALFASTHIPLDIWQHNHGIGGIFGDTVLGLMLSVSPGGIDVVARVLSLFLGFLTVVSGLYVLGFIRPELSAFFRFMLDGFACTFFSHGSYGSERDRSLHGRDSEADWDGYGDGDGGYDGDWQDSGDPRGHGAPGGRQEAEYGTLERSPRGDSTGAAPGGFAGQAGAPAGPHGASGGVLLRGPHEDPHGGLQGGAGAGSQSSPRGAPPSRGNAQGYHGGGGYNGSPEGAHHGGHGDGFHGETDGRAQTPPLAPGSRGGQAAKKPGLGGGLKDKIAEAIMRRRQRASDERARQSRPPLTLFPADGRFGGQPAQEGESLDAGAMEHGGAGTRGEEPRDAMPPAAPNAAGGRKIPPLVTRSAKAKPRESAWAKQRSQDTLFKNPAKNNYASPSLGLLSSPDGSVRSRMGNEALEQNAKMLENVLEDYGVKGDIVSVKPGPVVTMYELEPAPGVKASRVIGLSDDIARSMSALSARVSTVPGKNVIGIELPNAEREMVLLREILSSKEYGDSKTRLPIALGKEIGGESSVVNLASMPHLLIAGTTGSGKSVAINTMILSLLYKLSPEECRLIMIDPKMLELSVYDGIPHLLSPVVTDPKRAVLALKWVVGEMEERYRTMSKMGVRNIHGHNAKVKDALSRGESFSRTVQTGFDEETGEPIYETEEFRPETLPYIVVVVDEMADLMMVAGKEIEACIQRLAQMARASGIHLIMATQRPSVDVITGTIKANFPTRISFQVTSKVDSRTILGEQGAEQLLGQGDMLYMAGGGKITRIHAPFVSDSEVEEVARHLRAFGPPEYVSGVSDGPDEDSSGDINAVLGLGAAGDDDLYEQAVEVVLRDRKCSTSYIQRRLSIGYNKAAGLVEQMEERGVVSPANHVGRREILAPE